MLPRNLGSGMIWPSKAPHVKDDRYHGKVWPLLATDLAVNMHSPNMSCCVLSVKLLRSTNESNAFYEEGMSYLRLNVLLAKLSLRCAGYHLPCTLHHSCSVPYADTTTLDKTILCSRASKQEWYVYPKLHAPCQQRACVCMRHVQCSARVFS